jgi:hypothetical protein
MPALPVDGEMNWGRTGAVTDTLISACGSVNFQMFGLDVQYDNAADNGTGSLYTF